MSDNKITLHRRDEIQIDTLFDVINPNYRQVYGGINELTFRVPYFVEDVLTHQIINNPSIGKIKDYYLLKYNNEFMVLTILSKFSDDKSEFMEIQAFSRQYELGDKRVRDFKTGIPSLPVKNLTNTANLLLTNTNWSIDTVQASLDIKFRAIDISDSTVLDSINRLCDTWNCIPKFNTINRTISFVEYAADGFFLGLNLTQNNYLKNIKYEKISELKTLLKCYGKNGVSFQVVNPNGQNYITNYSFLKQAGYMSQDLIDAINNYETAVSNNISFANYLSQKSQLQSTKLTKENELDELLNNATTGLYAIKDLIDIANANEEDTTELKGQETAQQALVDAKNTEINDIDSQIATIDSNIQTLKDTTLNIATYLTSSQISLLRDFTFEDVYVDSAITEKGNTIAVLQEFYNEAVKRLELVATPRYSATLDIVDFYQATGTEIDRDKLVLGSICKVKYPILNIILDVKIVEIEQDFDNFKLTIKVANEKDIKQGFSNSQSLVKLSADNKSILSVYGDTWSAGGSANDVITQFLNNAIDTTKQTILAGVNNSVEIGKRGITLQDPDNPQYILRLTAGAVGISDDSGQTFRTGISKGCIHGEVIGGQIYLNNIGKFNKILKR